MNASFANREFRSVPANWTLKELGQVASLKTGGSAPQGDGYFKDGKHPFVRVQHFNGTEKYLTRWDLITDEAVKEYRLKLFKKDTILFPKSGASIMLEKRVKLPFDAYVVSHLCCVEPKSIENDFLFYLLKFNKFAHTTDGSTLPYLNLNHLAKRLIPIPPFPEQRRIAHILSTMQTAIEQQARLIALTRELKSALMQKLFTEGLRGEKQKETGIGLVPENWEIKRFDEFVTLQRGQDLPKYSFQAGSVPVIGATSVIGYHNKSNVKGPGVTVVRSGSSAGKPLYIAEDFWAHNVVLFVKDFNGNNVKFTYFKIQNLDLTKYKAGVAVPTLNRNTFKGIEVAIPQRDEQEEIASMLDTVEKKSGSAQKKKDLLQELFRTLLHQLMTGQVRVNKMDLETLEK